GQAEACSAARARRGTPPSSRNCLACPSRVPRPAAGRITSASKGFTPWLKRECPSHGQGAFGDPEGSAGALQRLKIARRSLSIASSSQFLARESSLIRSERAVSIIFRSPKERSLSLLRR